VLGDFLHGQQLLWKTKKIFTEIKKFTKLNILKARIFSLLGGGGDGGKFKGTCVGCVLVIVGFLEFIFTVS